MRFDRFNANTVSLGVQDQERLNAFVTKVFGVMTLGLGLTTLTSFLTMSSVTLLTFAVKARWFFLIGELGLVFYLASRISRMDAATATRWFFLYAGLNGVSMAPIFLIYTQASVVSAFFISAGLFGSMTAWGMATKKDLTSLGSLCFMVLLGAIIATIVNLFIGSSGFQLILSYLMVAVFTGLTAYDAQKIKQMGASGMGTGNMAVIGALMLYLDFINLFLNILFIIGGSRD